jgi:hypothetical protein
MAKNRDDFKKATIEVMAKRVGYLCSNPDCKRLTVGANFDIAKSTSIGVAAHITAASPGGPRFNPELSEVERIHIENGIWLCNDCSTLIDKDPDRYPVDLLKQWKENAEIETLLKLRGEHKVQPNGVPFLEVDLVWRISGRWNMGYSDKNPIEMHEGKPYYIIGNKPIIHWGLDWSFDFFIYNNSNYPAYNVKVESIGKEHFSQIDSLPKINNVPAFQNIDLKAKYEDYIEGDHSVADNIIKARIPQKFNDLQLRLTYLDDNRQEHSTYVQFDNGEIINKKA